jgi:hypothetical protein
MVSAPAVDVALRPAGRHRGRCDLEFRVDGGLYILPPNIYIWAPDLDRD